MHPLPFPPLSKNYLFEVKRFVAFCRNSISSQICKLFSHKNCISIHTSSRKLSCTFGRLKNDKCSIWSICEKIKVITFANSAEIINVPSGRFVKNSKFFIRQFICKNRHRYSPNFWSQEGTKRWPRLASSNLARGIFRRTKRIETQKLLAASCVRIRILAS